jgi:hypothetical protein
VLAQSASARFYGAGEALRVGSPLAPRQEYALKSGRAELRFRSGVTAIVEGPAVFEVRDETRLRIVYGKCAVNVVAGAEGFAVETPLTKIVDRGTRFAVDVDEAGETEVQVVQGKAEVQAPEAAPSLLTQGAGKRFSAGDRAGKDVPFDQQRFPRDMPDRVVRYSTTPRPGSAGAEQLTGVTVRRGGREMIYGVRDLIGVQLIHFKNLLKNGKFIATVTDGPDPALTGGSRTALLEDDTNVNTGVINPGGSKTPLATDPIMNDPEDPQRPNTPGMALRFRRPVVNDAGPDIVLFDYQPVVQPEYGDPFHVSPLHFDAGLHSHSVTRFDLGTFSPEAQVIAGFRLNQLREARSCLSRAPDHPDPGPNFTVTSKLLAVGIDLSDLGYPPAPSVDGIFIQDALDDGNQVDPCSSPVCRLWRSNDARLRPRFVASSSRSCAQEQEAGRAVSFSRDIRPLLSQNCFACHGPDRKNPTPICASTPAKAPWPRSSRQARRERADRGGSRRPTPASGCRPGRAGRSSTRASSRSSGAGSSRAPSGKRPGPSRAPSAPLPTSAMRRGPELRSTASSCPPREGRAASLPEAERALLLRRVSFDLTGLPPTIEDVDAFLADPRADAYEKVVERLLASPRYGERMAMEWMDAARYADTHGLHVDSHRDMWPWRDGVIRAFNANQRFDQFTIEQLAGDLLPDATTEQKVASGFNRNHMISYQNSQIPEKVRVAYVVDRVNTTATVWLGLTMGCAQCHDHKFDPIPQADYYRMFAFFNTVAEKPLDGESGNAVPLILLDDKAEVKLDLGSRKDARQMRDFLSKTPNAMVMQEMAKPRETFLLDRGEYDQRRQKVEPGTPTCLPPMATELPQNRLGLARWLVDPAHPLTARVQVNRLWQMVFGTGLVETSEDFGAQGEGASHPELLDFLAVEFVESGWDVKGMLRRLMTSATYRQSSKVAPEVLARDPRNRLLARGPRFRLPAEMIRDGALAAGGLLREKIGGPGVFPYQPAGVWEAVASGRAKEYTAQFYRQDHGDNLYRRSLYTFWKRLAPPPALAAFDAPSREACVVRRQRTNTPLQALVTLNDPGYLEAARGLATRALREPEEGRLAWTFRAALARTPAADEIAILSALLREQRAQFGADGRAATAIVEVGESRRDPALDVAELAAWTLVAAAILNLDETLTKG